jgi:hypothetical protein
VSGRDTPPSIQDGPYGWEPDAVGGFEDGDRINGRKLTEEIAKKLGTEIWEASTNWLNSGRRARWNDSLRAFQNMHASGSKYLSGDYRYRSSLYRPKSRTMVRRGEASTASAFFANEDVVSITAEDDDNPQQQASAGILKELLQYRLTKTIPWFLTIVGARQDAEVMGICIGKADWEYEEKFVRTELRPQLGDDGMPMWDNEKQRAAVESVDLYRKIKDQPYVDLIAPENFRFEPGCDWRNPVKSSPYIIELQPVYIQEAMERMESRHGAPAEWKAIPESALRAATDLDDDVTRRTRETGRVPGKDNDAWKPKDFDICWTRLNIVRYGGKDWCYRTLGSAGEILEPPRPIEEVYLHGERPYVVGCIVLETHKSYPSSKIELTTDLQRAANQDWNSRFDNVMLALQPRQFIREGSGQDINDLRTMMPGKVVMVSAAKGEPLTNTVTWDRPPPVDGAAYMEQDRINLDWDDLTGAFTNSSQASSQITQQSATGMHLMSGEASGLNEYELRLFAETFVEPLVRLLIKLEQAYETDPVVLAIAGKKAQLFEKFNVSEITDELLNHEVTTKVNVGIGSTNPQMKLRNFATGAQILGSIFGPMAREGANFQEVSKEVFSLLGYKDGERFVTPNYDPRVAELQQQLQKLQGKDGGDDGASKIQVANINAQSKMAVEELKARASAENDQRDFHTQQMEEQAATQREILKQHAEVHKIGLQHAHDMRQGQVQMAQDQTMQAGQQQHDMGKLQSTQDHDVGKMQATQQHEQAMLPAASAAPQKSAESASPAAPAAAAPMDMDATHQLMVQMGQHLHGQMQQGSQDTMQGFVQGLQTIAQGMQQGNEQLAHLIAAIAQKSDQNLQNIADQVAQSNQAVVAALTRKKKVVRGPDGRVAGVE